MWPNPQETADFVTFTEEILNGKLHFLCNGCRNWHSETGSKYIGKEVIDQLNWQILGWKLLRSSWFSCCSRSCKSVLEAFLVHRKTPIPRSSFGQTKSCSMPAVKEHVMLYYVLINRWHFFLLHRFPFLCSVISFDDLEEKRQLWRSDRFAAVLVPNEYFPIDKNNLSPCVTKLI